MSRFPPHQFHGTTFGPRHPGGNGGFPQRPRGFTGPQRFPNFHHEGARFQGPPHGRGMPPEQFFHRGPRPPYRGRGGRGGRHDGHGPPQSHYGGGFGHQEYFEEPFHPHMGDPRSFQRPNNNRDNPNFGNKNFKHKGQKGGGKKKKNENKVKPPKDINYSHYCDICDRGFQSDEELKGHIAQHVKCKGKDCRFEGHPKVVRLHEKLHHGPGSQKLRWLDTPEDIQKWRNDRKRNFPTAENIAKKDQRVEQQQLQGNVLKTKQFGKIKRTHRGKRSAAKKLEDQMKSKAYNLAKAQKAAAELNKSEEVPSKRIKTEDGEDRLSTSAQADPTKPSQGLKTDQSIPSSSGQRRSAGAEDFDPLSHFASVDNDGEDEEFGEAQGGTPQIEVAPKGTFGALGSLAACYDSDSDDSFTEEKDDATNEQENSAQGITAHGEDGKQSCAEDATNPTLPSASRQPVMPAQDADEGRCHGSGTRDESRSYEEQEEDQYTSRKDRKRPKKAPNTRGRRGGKQAEQNKGTLLEMLLAPEIRRERNIMLQCVRYIVKNNFFQDSPH